jgi:predicted nucleotidyltransferase
VARGEAKKNSDIDLLVKFRENNKIGLFKLDDLQKEFEKKFGRRVDLVTKLNKYVEPYALKDLRTLYEER